MDKAPETAIEKVLDAIRGLIGFFLCMAFVLLGNALMWSTIISWSWYVFSFLKSGVWHSPVEPWILSNIKPQVHLSWIGLSQIVQWIIDVVFHPVSRLFLGGILGAVGMAWAERSDAGR